MVEVIYDGNLGNNLFQYCFGRILAEKLGYRLSAKPIVGFPRTYDLVEGAAYPLESQVTLRGQKPNLDFLRDTTVRYHVLLTGYFQRYEYYEAHAQSIKKWLAIEDNVEADIGPHDVVLSIRRGPDYIPQYGLPLSYYENALASIQFDRVFICTNEPDDPFIRYFKKKYGAVIRAGSFQGARILPTYWTGALDNLVFIKKFSKIIISNSTFAWWAAYLSDAEEIIFPRPANGFWSKNDPVSKNINIEVNETRYQYLECEKYRSEFPSEIMRNYLNTIVLGSKAGMKGLLPFLRKNSPEKKSEICFNDSAND